MNQEDKQKNISSLKDYRVYQKEYKYAYELLIFKQFQRTILNYKVSFMDEAELRELIPPKQQNPLLKRSKFNILSKPQETVEYQNALAQPHITLLFFAAEWCNVSKSFVTSLKKFYGEVNLENKKIQIIYIGLDKVKKDYQSFTRGMPWVGLPFQDERIAGLKEFYDIRAIPKLLLLDSRGEQVKRNCREDVYSMKQDETYQKWNSLKVLQQKSYFYQNPS